MERFTIHSEPTTPVVEPDRADYSLDTATRWTLHVPVWPSNLHETARLAEVLRTFGFVSDYLGGDSFREWAEPVLNTDTDEVALHLAFPARNVDHARHQATWIAGYLRIRDGYALSTAGDWAEQTPIHFQE